MDAAYWSEIIEGFRTWLLGFEPSFFHANTALRVSLIFIIAKASLSLLVAVIKLIAFVIDVALAYFTWATARWLIYDFVGKIAPVYVRVEAVMLRIWRPVIQTGALGRDNDETASFERVGMVLPRPLNFFRSGLLAYIFLNAVVLPVVVLTVTFVFVRSLTRINILNIASAVTALWLVGLIQVTKIDGDLRLGEIPVSALVASGTLLALIFVALNTDVRGKAELNKVASLTCRTALHETTPKILRISDALGAMRRLAVRRLAFFPTASELFELTGRDDLCWRGSRLLPISASLVAESTSPLSVKLADILEALIDPQWPYKITANSIISREEVFDQDATIMRESENVCDILIRLYESGLADKINKVLSLPARHFLVELFHERFGLDAADAVHLMNDQDWYGYALNEDFAVELQERWYDLADADPDDPRLREECINLNRILRSTVYYARSTHWQIAVAEYHLRYLAEAIDSSLRPRLLDRIKQLFDK